jgi:hypothetical protein
LEAVKFVEFAVYARVPVCRLVLILELVGIYALTR